MKSSTQPLVASQSMPPASKIPFVDLKAQFSNHRAELEAAISSVLDRGDFIHGGAVREFEAAFAAYLGVKHAIGVANGLDALRLSLVALGIGPGDEVILPATTFIASALAISAAGAKPVLVDPDPRTHNISAHQISAAITPRTAAVMPVHFAGRAIPMQDIVAVAERHGLAIVEDAAQAHGARNGGRFCGTWGSTGCFSFYPSKNLGAFGDGGLISTNDDQLAQRLRALGNYGQRTKHEHVVQGVNSRLDTLQASVLHAKLAHLDRWNAARQRHAHQYREELAGLEDRLDLPAPDDELHGHVYHIFAVQTRERDAFREHLERCDVQTAIHYPQPIHLHAAYAGLGLPRGSFPVAERHAAETLSCPMFPELTRDQISQVCRSIRSFFKHRTR